MGRLMSRNERTRLVAWGHELRAVHDRLREALAVARSALETGAPDAPATRDLLLFCHGFCAGLTGHHEGEDQSLFPVLAERHPHLRETVRRLTQDHSMIAHLLTGLQGAVQRSATPTELLGHLEGVSAIMESHFRYEERTLLSAPDTLSLDADPTDALGPL